MSGEAITWHFKGKLIWMGTTPQGHDAERDVKTGRVKRVYSHKELQSKVARNGDSLPRARESYES